VFGRRPIETSTQSASSVSLRRRGRLERERGLLALDRDAGDLGREAQLHALLANSLAGFLAHLAVHPGSSASRNSTTTTSAPRRRQTEPSSSPITPPPITTIFFGTAASSSAPVESTTMPLALSTSTPGSGVTEEPVAMTTFFAVTDWPATSTCARP
jgi:hypothetical protein